MYVCPNQAVLPRLRCVVEIRTGITCQHLAAPPQVKMQLVGMARPVCEVRTAQDSPALPSANQIEPGLRKRSSADRKISFAGVPFTRLRIMPWNAFIVRSHTASLVIPVTRTCTSSAQPQRKLIPGTRLAGTPAIQQPERSLDHRPEIPDRLTGKR